MRVEAVQLKARHLVDFLREEVSVRSQCERARGASDLPNVVVPVGDTTCAVSVTRVTPNVVVIAAADDCVHKAINEYVVDDS